MHPRYKKSKLTRGLQILIEDKAKRRCELYALVPRRGRPGDACLDIFVAQDTVISPGINLPPTDVPSGIKIKLPQGTKGEIKSRSSTYINYPTLLLRSAPIDENYTGPLNPRFVNMGTEPVTVHRGERLAQLEIVRYVMPQVYVVLRLPKTNRGDKRYGSSGR